MRKALWMMACFAIAASCCVAQTSKYVANGAAASTKMPQAQFFAGYSNWSPHDQVNGVRYRGNHRGMIFSGAYFWSSHLGAQLEGERAQQTANDGMRAFSVGPIFRYPMGRPFVPYLHALVGATGVTGPNAPTINGSTFYYNPEHWGPLFTLGGGADYRISWRHHSLTLRLVQADYQYSHVDFGTAQATTGGIANINAARFSTGIVYSMDRVVLHRRR